jgi:hypothetical protein
MELILREAAAAAGLGAGVTCMVLRNCFAVHCLENGASIRALQETLGHASVNTTMEYRRCLLPAELTTVADGMPGADMPQVPVVVVLSQNDSVEASVKDCAVEEVTTVPCVASVLFDQPVAVDAVELPLRDDTGISLLDKAAAFYRLIKTHVFGRFLGMRRATVATG